MFAYSHVCPQPDFAGYFSRYFPVKTDRRNGHRALFIPETLFLKTSVNPMPENENSASTRKK
jgi:hypothetical protein